MLLARDKSPSQQAAHRHHKAPCVVNVSGMGFVMCAANGRGTTVARRASIKAEEDVSVDDPASRSSAAQRAFPFLFFSVLCKI